MFCGHEYTKSNINFLLKVDGNNPYLEMLQKRTEEALGLGMPTVPSVLKDERLYNSFMRVRDEEIQ